MASYDGWHKRGPQAPEGPFAGYTLRDFLLQRPLHAVLLLPWPVLLLTLVLVPPGWVQALGGSVTPPVAGLVPMVKRMAAASSNPQLVATVLSLLWIAGPLWTVTTVLLCFRSHRAGVYQVPAARLRDVILGLAVTVGALLLLANLAPSTGKRGSLMTFALANPVGLLLAGWFFFGALFGALGLVVANPVIRVFGNRNA